ncbi:peptidoglycan-binding domain-containing protein [Streptomyces sp. NPDC001546]|uniref:peptidoglycan-binding domain-containing protein n=1 Tax=Streptomyces sp. NPDC001546 TaxID=3364585 RepID=UPI0036B2BABF
MKRRITALGMTAASIAATLVGFAPTASAATPSCTSETRIWQGDFYTDVPSTSSGSTDCILRKGMTSNAVYRLQYTLYICNGFNSLGLDGIYGDETAGAVRQFQDRMHIGVDGTYGPQTRKAMYWSFNSKTNYYCGKI